MYELLSTLKGYFIIASGLASPFSLTMRFNMHRDMDRRVVDRVRISRLSPLSIPFSLSLSPPFFSNCSHAHGRSRACESLIKLYVTRIPVVTLEIAGESAGRPFFPPHFAATPSVS